MSEIQIEIAAQGGVVLKVLMYLKNGKINDATACFAEKFEFKDRGIGLEFKDRSAWQNSSRRPRNFIQILRCRLTQLS